MTVFTRMDITQMVMIALVTTEMGTVAMVTM